MKQNIRIGFGYDVHQLVEGKKLILGGVEIPFEKGLLGHSDADALMHAICDAVLGALALGDIGKHFPDTDPKYKGANSTIFLKGAAELLKDNGYCIGNIDSTIVIEKPKMAPHTEQMRENIASALGININQISVKATRSEKMGFVGRGEGVQVFATALLELDNN